MTHAIRPDIANACRYCSELISCGGKCTGAQYPCDCWTNQDPWGEAPPTNNILSHLLAIFDEAP